MPIDRPTKEELLDSVLAWIDTDLKPTVTGPLGYELRIATSLLRTLRRELLATDELASLERAALAALLPDLDEASRTHGELCARIRDGRIDHRDPALHAHLDRIALAKIAIDQPTYPTYRARLARGVRGG